jgi:hypothetical protein
MNPRTNMRIDLKNMDYSIHKNENNALKFAIFNVLTSIQLENIDVKCNSGLVSIYGIVTSLEERFEIAIIISKIAGVKEVINHLCVDLDF